MEKISWTDRIKD